MPALLKFLVLIAIFLLASNANAFTSLTSVAGNQVWVNHLIHFQQPISDPTSKPSHEPSSEPTKRMDLDAELPSILSSKRVKYSLSPKQDAELPREITDSTNAQTCGLCHNKKSEQVLLAARAKCLKPPESSCASLRGFPSQTATWTMTDHPIVRYRDTSEMRTHTHPCVLIRIC